MEIERVNFHNEENGWTVLKARNLDDGHNLTAVGSFAEVHPGEFYMLFGNWTEHRSFGKQFKIERAVATRPHTKAGIIRYLSSGLFRGIGEKTAEKIVKYLGLDTFKILDEDPEQLRVLPTLGRRTANKIIKSWQEQRQLAEVMMFLNHHGISAGAAQKMIRLYGSETIQVLSENPYRLIKDIHGVGFLTADRIARSVGIPSDHPRRLQEGILYQLQQAEDQGHCFLTSRQLCEQLETTLQLQGNALYDQLVPNITTLNEQHDIVSSAYQTPEGEATSCHYSRDLYLAEVGVAASLQRLLAGPFASRAPSPALLARIDSWLQRYCAKSAVELSAAQRQSVFAAATNKVFILTGGPGVGKTTTANIIIRLLRAMDRSVALCAPTGRAAQRLSEVSAMTAKTIHRMLEWSPAERRFLRDEQNPLQAQVIIVDEVSMLDIRIANSLFAAVPAAAQLILIGDVDQLPAVGPGNVLRDLIQSQRVPCQTLDEVFRQAQTSRIIQAAHKINVGVVPEFSDAEGSDCRFFKADSPQAIKKIIHELLTTSLPKAGYDPTSDVQILTPMNKGDLGNHIINDEIQALLNSPKSERPESEYKRKGITLRAKDKVIQNVNNYDLSVFNGDIGYILHTKVEGAKLIVQFGEREVYYDEEQAQDLNLAYSITIHKSQGSEFPVVIIPMSMSHFIMQQRNLIYTALTRAKKLAIFVGEMRALAYAVKNQVSALRQTRLMERLAPLPAVGALLAASSLPEDEAAPAPSLSAEMPPAAIRDPEAPAPNA